MPRTSLVILIGLSLMLPAGVVRAQEAGGLPLPIPPPLPEPKQPEAEDEEEGGYLSPIAPDSEGPWGLAQELLGPLFDKAGVYAEYTRRFTCTETARLAEYNPSGGVDGEKERRYGYLLVRTEDDSVREYRQKMTKSGEVKAEEIADSEKFPPAYAWVFLFSRFNEPYFAYRYVGERYDGFDWVHDIQFKGSLPFTDGRDIRQWEGRVVVNAVTWTPIEIVAEPNGQSERLEALYRQWANSFNFMGMRPAPRPFGYRARVDFLHRTQEQLTFPTELRYDTFRAVGLDRINMIKASTRSYSDYRITVIKARPEVGDKVDAQQP